MNVIDVITGKNSQQQPPAEQAEPKGYTYRCTEKCTYKGKFYREGDIIVLPEKKEVPHFEPAGKE